MKESNDNWLVFDDKTSLSKVLARAILDIAEKAILKKSCFSIVLTGGKSAISLYKILSKSESNWNKWHIYISDERSLPAGHKDRNDKEINKIWLDNSTIPKKNIHFIKAELGLFEARLKYENTLRKIDKFDIVLLSVGEDGHIASLFPNHVYPEKQMVVVERSSPKPPKERISISYQRLNKAHYIFKLIIGNLKQNSIDLLRKGVDLPASRVVGEHKDIYVSVVRS
jgi:6-phosphogluconolactonase